MTRQDLISLAKTKGFGGKALHQIMENCGENLTMDDYRAARDEYWKRKSYNS